MKIFNKILGIVIISGMLLSCNKELEIEPQHLINQSKVYLTEENVESALVGAYSVLVNGGLYGTNMNLMSELLAAEDNVEWYGTFNTYKDLYNKNAVATNGEASRTWLRAYEVINIANNVIDSVSVVGEADQSRVKGEAQFLRGLMYFELVRFYGLPWKAGEANNVAESGVPLVLKGTKTIGEQSKVKRNTVAEVYAQIIEDLTSAKTLLPKANYVRANTFVASAFLARVYLQKSDFANALSEANRVIEEGKYKLGEKVTTVFSANETTEAIFEVQQNELRNAGRVNDGVATFYSDNGFGRGDIDVGALRKKFDPDDLRRVDLIYKGVRYGGRNSAKWTDPTRNIVIMRLAEMHLIRAEANVRLGSSVGATPLMDLEKIRERAGLATTSATLEDILLERELELAFEGHRLHDIKRTMGKTGDFNYDSPELILPIPQRERDVNENLKQNEGY